MTTTEREGLIRTHYIIANDLEFSGGKWRRPTEETLMGEMLSATSFNVSGKLVADPSANRFSVSFELSKTENSFGLEGTDAHINLKVGKEEYLSHNVQTQLELLKPNEITLVGVEFVYPESINSEKVHFNISDTTSKQKKSGLVLHRAIIEEIKL